MNRVALSILALLVAALLIACALTGSVGISLSLPIPTPTPTIPPEMTLDYSINLTQGILLGAMLLILIILGGSLGTVAMRNRKK